MIDNDNKTLKRKVATIRRVFTDQRPQMYMKKTHVNSEAIQFTMIVFDEFSNMLTELIKKKRQTKMLMFMVYNPENDSNPTYHYNRIIITKNAYYMK